MFTDRTVVSRVLCLLSLVSLAGCFGNPIKIKGSDAAVAVGPDSSDGRANTDTWADAGPDSAPVSSPPDAAVSTSPDAPEPDTTSADLPSDPFARDTADVPLPGTGGVGGAGVGGTNGAGGVAGAGGGGGVTGGAPGSGGVVGSGGRGGSTGGAPGSGGVIGSGGIATGGAVASGGTMATGGVVGTGGITGTGGATCQPKARDCTSSLDNNCNGTPDNQETTYCACAVGQSRACQEHPGYDGVGICKAGSQTCAASTDKATSSWGACSSAVGPGTRNCTSSVDNDCNGTPDSQETAYCQCSAGRTQSCLPAGMCTAGSQPCAASSDKTTTGWGPCTGYTGPTTQYRDYDGDGYGNPAQSAQVCPGTSGYVSNADDCDDSNSNFKPGISICGTVTQKKTCVSGGGGVASVEACDQGCINGNCRSDGTIGVPGYVSCTSTHTPRCLTGDGCELDDGAGTCGTAGSLSHLYCDGPNDCTGQVCCLESIRDLAETKCYSGACPTDTGYYQVCDPLATNTCNCVRFTDWMPIYVCM